MKKAIVGVEELEDRPVRIHETSRFVDGKLEHIRLIVQCADTRRNIAERPLGLRPPFELGLRGAELIDQAAVGDGHRRVVGEETHQLDRRAVEEVRLTRIDPEHAEGLVVGDEGRCDQGADADPANNRVGTGGMLETRVRPVVTRNCNPAFGDSQAEQPLPDSQLQPPQNPSRARIGYASTEGPANQALLVDTVDQPSVRLEQACGLVHGELEQLVWLADRGQARGDLRQRSLLVHALGELLAGPGQLGNQLSVGDRTCRVVREGPDHRCVVLVEGFPTARERGQDSGCTILDQQGRDEHRTVAKARDSPVGAW